MVLAGLVQAMPAQGNRGGFVALEDHTGRIEAALFDDTWTLYSELLNKDEIIVVEGRVATDDFSGGFRMTAQKDHDTVRGQVPLCQGRADLLRGPGEEHLLIPAIDLRALPGRFRPGLAQLQQCPGPCPSQLGEEWNVKACEELVAALGELDMVSDARLVY